MHSVEALLIAVETNDIALCRSILTQNPALINEGYPTIVDWIDKSPFNPGATAIHYAARSGHYKMVEILIKEFNANINHKDHENWNTLHYASIAGHANIVSLLMEHEVDDSVISLVEKCTPLQFAEYKHWTDVVHLLSAEYNANGDYSKTKEHEYSNEEIKDILINTEKRLNGLILPRKSLSDGKQTRKLCKNYKMNDPQSCPHGSRCWYSHLDIDYVKLEGNAQIELDLYLHRYRIDWTIYSKLRSNLCESGRATLVFQCIDTLLESGGNGKVWFLTYHNRRLMREQRMEFESTDGVTVIRSGSISRLDHIVILQADSCLEIINVLQCGDESFDIVGVTNQLQSIIAGFLGSAIKSQEVRDLHDVIFLIALFSQS